MENSFSGEHDCLAYLGAPTYDHCQNLIRLMDSRGIRTCVFADSIAAGTYANFAPLLGSKRLGSIRNRAGRVINQIRGTRDPHYMDKLVAGIDECGATRLIAYWGTRPLADLIGLKRRRPSIKTFLNVLCHPTGLSAAKIAVQNAHFRKVVGCCDGLIASTEVMKSYLEHHVVRDARVPVVVSPPYLASSYFPDERRLPAQPSPNLLFLGRMDWRRAQACDNALPFLAPLMDAGVHVHFHRAAESRCAHPNAHVFGYMSLGEIISYATQFDASLIMYNLASCGRTDRFRVTVPDRLLASVAAGIPVAIPAQGYDACYEYLRDYRGVIRFTTMSELAAVLKDGHAMNRLKEFARQDSRNYVGEQHLDSLTSFIFASATTTPSSAAFALPVAG